MKMEPANQTVDAGASMENDSIKKEEHSNYRPNREKRLYNKNPCWFYINDYCKFGSRCKFYHPRIANPKFRRESQRPRDTNSFYSYESSNWKPNTFRNEIGIANSQAQDYRTNSRHNPPQKFRPRNYRVFTNSNRFTTANVDCPIKRQPQELEKPTEKTENNKPVKSVSNLNTRLPLKLALLSENDLQFMRETEIIQLNKRYPNVKYDHGDNSDVFFFSFSSSDPDWSFNLKSVDLRVSLSKQYPKEICEVTVLNQEECMPDLLQKFLNRSLKQWIEERHQLLVTHGETEIVLRPFFRWLDKNLERLFIDGLRKVKLDVEARNMGLEFVPFEALPGANLSSNSQIQEKITFEVDSLTKNLKELECKEISEPVEDEALIAVEESKCSTQTQETSIGCQKRNDVSSKKGTEVKLLNFELKEGAASLQCQKIAVNVRCTRCKTYSDISSVTKQKPFAGSCNKCHQIHSAVFHPILMHAFSGILGYLHFNGCQAVDLPLVQCDFVLDCLNCNKQNNVNGINYGQTFSTWCLFCNQKLSISAQAAKFEQLQPVERNTKLEASVSETNKRKIRDPLIEAGKPLPNEGNCKHYKKSHRWLRFPCCGKAYPCDLCHDEKETDHEMKYASRMICGFCSKEQPYSKEKPCEFCTSVLTKKSGNHWEGGKGCRDRIRMSRDDKHKYAGTGKTISRKVVAVTPKKKNQK